MHTLAFLKEILPQRRNLEVQEAHT